MTRDIANATESRSTEAADQTVSEAAPKLADDLLRGADEIAEFLFGDRKHRRKVYHLINDAKRGPPHFRLGAIICARKTRLLRWIVEQESR